MAAATAADVNGLDWKKAIGFTASTEGSEGKEGEVASKLIDIIEKQKK